VDTASLADALVAVAESFLAEKIAAAENPDVYQVIVHASADMLPPAREAARRQAAAAELSGELLPEMENTAADVPAGTPPTVDAGALPGRAAGPGRCHVEDGPAISVTTMRMLTCEAALSWMTHDRDGSVLDVGRRSRRPTAAIRRAARERDACRCRFPGCDSRRVDLHHVEYWSKGGQTKLDSPTLPGPAGEIAACHAADITPSTIIPAWYGDRLDLDHAIYVCFANAENQARRAQQATAA
jgi:hypothetical protein